MRLNQWAADPTQHAAPEVLSLAQSPNAKPTNKHAAYLSGHVAPETRLLLCSCFLHKLLY